MNGVSEIWVEGGKILSGAVTIQGSKNAVLPMLAACLLQEGTMVLHGCPRILDVFVMEKILQSLGAKTWWNTHSLFVDCKEISEYKISNKYAESMRSSVLLMGSMLVRKGEIQITYPGGCKIGKRPIDIHLQLLEKMGCCIQEAELGLKICCPHGLSGVIYEFPFPSVGAVENGILAAVGAKGISRLKNCAIEPEVTHLCCLLQRMGAKIYGIGTRELTIEGGYPLRAVEYDIPADRIVAGTYLYAVAATRGSCVLRRAPSEEMKSILQVYEKMGGQWECIGGKLKANAENVRYPVCNQITASYPGFPTDMQSILLSVLLTISGNSCVCEEIFENRFQVIPQLQHMGGNLCCRGTCAYVKGGSSLHGTCVEAKELRGGAALIIAGLAAKGVTRIKNAHYIQRGYEDIDKRIQELGGQIQMQE